MQQSSTPEPLEYRFTVDVGGYWWVRTPEGELCGPYTSRHEAAHDFANNERAARERAIPADRPEFYDDRYQDMADNEFHGLECACGRRMHASDTECSRCYHDREFPQD